MIEGFTTGWPNEGDVSTSKERDVHEPIERKDRITSSHGCNLNAFGHGWISPFNESAGWGIHQTQEGEKQEFNKDRSFLNEGNEFESNPFENFDPPEIEGERHGTEDHNLIY